MNSIVNEVINETATNNVIIDNDPFKIGFNTIISNNNEIVRNSTIDDSLPTIYITNENLFYKKLNAYVATVLETRSKFPTFSFDKQQNILKCIVAFLFTNASTQDFVNPIQFIDRNISFLNDTTFDDIKGGLITKPLSSFDGSSIVINVNENNIFMETPYKLDISLIKNNGNEILSYSLPSISYGISTDEGGKKTCYVYAVQNPKPKPNESDDNIKYTKFIKRALYKLNDGVSSVENEEYKDNDCSDYYSENISDVSPSAVLSSSILFSLLAQNGITDIKIVDYLPIRWNSKKSSIELICSGNETRLAELEKKHASLQNNITNKFLRTFRRVTHHLDEASITSFPKEVDDCMHIKLYDTNLKYNNPILQSIDIAIVGINDKMKK